MKKYKIFLLLITAGVFFSSCYKDKGNYNYTPKEVISITGIAASYDKISQKDSIVITPQVSSNMPGADFEYFWGIYETNVQGYAPVIDTITKSINLNYFVKQAAKPWVLVFGTKNKKTGYQQLATTTLNVNTQFTRGWYVLKDDGAHTDLDLFVTPTSVIPSSQVNNVLSLINKKQLDGKAGMMNIETTYKVFSANTNIYANTRVLYLTSDKDATVVDIGTMNIVNDFQNLFYNVPSVKKPDFLIPASQADYFINDGQLYSIYAMSSNVGKFGSRQLLNGNNPDYHLSKYFMDYVYGNPLFFDEMSSSFVSAGGAGTILNAITDNPISQMHANNNNKALLYMGLKNTSPYSSIALLQDKTDPTLKILSTLTLGSTSSYVLNIVNDTLSPASQLYNAGLVTTNFKDENLIYFVVGGNQLWSRNLTNGTETLQYTAPAGETINYIRHKRYAIATEPAYNYNYIIVGTTTGGNYTIRMFSKSSGNLAAAPDFTLTGSGTLGDVMFVSPSVSASTNYPSF